MSVLEKIEDAKKQFKEYFVENYKPLQVDDNYLRVNLNNYNIDNDKFYMININYNENIDDKNLSININREYFYTKG